MRISPQRHTLAVLRLLIGLGQKELADVLGCSKPTIQAIELKKLKMSDRLAGVVSLKTGINLGWLLDNDVARPPIDAKGEPYTKKTFENAQIFSELEKHPVPAGLASIAAVTINLERLYALILRSLINDNIGLCAYRLSKTFDELEKQFRVTEDDRKGLNERKIRFEKKHREFTAKLKRILDAKHKSENRDWPEESLGFVLSPRSGQLQVRPLDNVGIVEEESKTPAKSKKAKR